MIPAFPATTDLVRRTLVGSLEVHPVTAGELATTGNGLLGTDLSEDAVLALLDESPWLTSVGDDAYILTELLLEGWTVTHRVTHDEELAGSIDGLEDLVLAAAIASDLGENTDASVGGRGGHPAGSAEVSAAYCPMFRHPGGDLTWTTNDDEADPFGDNTEIRLVGPAGWLHGLAGALVGFERRGREWVWLGEVTDPVSQGSLDVLSDVEQVAVETLRATVADGETEYLVTAWLQRIQEEADRRFPAVLPRGVLRPTGELGVLADVAVRGQGVGPRGYDWDGHASLRTTRNLAGIWGVEQAAAEEFAFVISLVEAMAVAAEADPVGTLADKLLAAALLEDRMCSAFGRQEIAVQLRAQVLGATPARRALWERVLEAFEPVLGGVARASAQWLLSLIVEDSMRADDLLAKANASSPTLTAPHDEAFWRAACSGDAGATVDALHSWVDAGGVSKRVIEGREEPNTQQILRLAVRESLRVAQTVRRTSNHGRNDPCPCGSGLKYKRCHDGKALPEGGSSDDTQSTVPRATYLHALLLLHCDRIDPLRTARFVRILQNTRSTTRIADVPTCAIIVLDAASTVETERFLVEKRRCGASLSPSDEATIRDWASRPASVFEVTDRLEGSFVRLRDLRTGDAYEVHGPDSSRVFGPGDYLLSRVLPFGGQYRFAQGAMLVPAPDRDTTLQLLDELSSPNDLAYWMTGSLGRFTKPSFFTGPRNTDGDLIVIHQGRYRLRAHDPHVTPGAIAEQAVARLDGAPGFERHGGGAAEDASVTWMLHGDDVNHWLRGDVALHRDDAEVVVDLRTNSWVRYDELRVLLDVALKGLATCETVFECADDVEDIQFASDLGLDEAAFVPPGSVVGDGSDGSDVEMTDELRDEITAMMVSRWIDTSVPALGGLTPRQAADDPTRRGDLLRLLQGFARSDDRPMDLGGTFLPGPTATQLAAALGIRLSPTLPRLP